jgi:hypothetical protein
MPSFPNFAAFEPVLRDHRSEPQGRKGHFPCMLGSYAILGTLARGRVLVMPLCERGRMALFREQPRPPELPRGGVMADALVYGYTHHPAPLSITTSRPGARFGVRTRISAFRSPPFSPR